MKFSTNNYRKYVAAAAAAFAAIVMPVQAADCTTMCKDRAHQAGYAAAMQAQQQALNYCTSRYYGNDVNTCMYGKVAEIDAAYNAAYQQTYNQCMGSCS